MNAAAMKLLAEARELIRDPEKFHQGDYACDSMGVDVSARHEYAVAWCAAGALQKAIGDICAPDHGSFVLLEAAGRLVAEDFDRPYGIVPYVNDELGHSAVLEMFGKAIEMAGTEVTV